MATETVATVNNTEEKLPTLGLLEEEDEFEEFPVEDWDDSAENRLDVEEWEADWDDENLDDEFSAVLRTELDKVAAAAVTK